MKILMLNITNDVKYIGEKTKNDLYIVEVFLPENCVQYDFICIFEKLLIHKQIHNLYNINLNSTK